MNFTRLVGLYGGLMRGVLKNGDLVWPDKVNWRVI